jgi:hypothetical protein
MRHHCHSGATAFQVPPSRGSIATIFGERQATAHAENLRGGTNSGGAVGHVEPSTIWLQLFCRLSRALGGSGRRRLGTDLVMLALDYAFREYAGAQVDVGVSKDNTGAIGFYERLEFA